ncbi:MAG TPA: VTT domain-containing protein [Acidobacteriota bacterium]|nr:VTT domain-containing protein [Acidobacteriota bacterium]
MNYGYSLLFGAIFLEQLGLPIPASPVLILTGTLAATGKLSFSLSLALALVACLLGDLVWYWIGRTRGRKVLRLLCAMSLSPDSCVRKTETSFLKHGMNSLLFAKFVPGLNTIAPPMAGMFYKEFFAFFWRDTAGTLLYLLAFLLPGYFFSNAVLKATSLFHLVGRSLLWTVVLLLGLYVAGKLLRLKVLQKRLYRERITPEELHERMAAGEPIALVDLRSSSGQNTASLPGAIKIHPGEIDRHIHQLDPERWIVMYCT